MTADPKQVEAALKQIQAVAEAIRAAGPDGTPSGPLYVLVMPYMSLAVYESILGILERAGLVKQRNHVVRWVGPTF